MKRASATDGRPQTIRLSYNRLRSPNVGRFFLFCLCGVVSYGIAEAEHTNAKAKDADKQIRRKHTSSIPPFYKADK